MEDVVVKRSGQPFGRLLCVAFRVHSFYQCREARWRFNDFGGSLLAGSLDHNVLHNELDGPLLRNAKKTAEGEGTRNSPIKLDDADELSPPQPEQIPVLDTSPEISLPLAVGRGTPGTAGESRSQRYATRGFSAYEGIVRSKRVFGAVDRDVLQRQGYLRGRIQDGYLFRLRRGKL
jgi:hypothetical protein